METVNFWVQTVLLSGMLIVVLTMFIKVHNMDKRLMQIEEERKRSRREQEQEQEQEQKKMDNLVARITHAVRENQHGQSWLRLSPGPDRWVRGNSKYGIYYGSI